MSSSKIILLKEGAYTIDKENPEMCLGKGSFGKVYKGYDNNKHLWVAVKQINLELLQEYGQDMKAVILNEINVMKKFTKKMTENPCQYLVKQYDCFRSDKFIYIVMELCHNGTLFDSLSTKKTYSEAQVIQITQNLLQGLIYLENMNIAHRDLKPENIFITEIQENQKKQIVYKIGDFGFAAQKGSFTDVLGTYPYMAPQIFRMEQYTSKVDIWSLGITIHQLLFKELFYFGKNKWEIQDKIKLNQYFPTQEQKGKISSQMCDFLKLCLTKDKFMRPTASQLMKHEIFSCVNKHSSIFKILKFQMDRCQKMIKTAQMFREYQAFTQGQHKTIFIQLYLLKYAFCSMNRTAYSVMNKENYLSLPIDKFQQLIDGKNQNKWQCLKDLSQKVWTASSKIFTHTYNLFIEFYIPRFNQDDRQIMAKAVNDQPYEEPILQIFVNELKKWVELFKIKGLNSKFSILLQTCQNLLQSLDELN